MSKPMISHRSGEFGAIYSECAELLKEFFQTKNQIAIMTGSGTLGMDAAVAGIIGHEDKIVTISNGSSASDSLRSASDMASACP